MQKLRAHPGTGVMFKATGQDVVTSGPLVIYDKPSRVLKNFERVLSGGKPEILLMRKCGGIGDVLMTTPTLRELSKKFDTKIDYATDVGYLEGRLVDVLKYNPYIRKIVPWRQVDQEQYNMVIDLTCPCVAHEQPRAKPINRVDLFANHVGIQITDGRLDYYLQDEEIQWAQAELIQKRINKPFILIQSNSSSQNRDMPLVKYKQLVNLTMAKSPHLQCIICTHGAESKKEEWRDIYNSFILHNYTTRQIAALVYLSELVVCLDSAVLHLACALKKKTLTLFGPTDPRARINYHPEAVAIWAVSGLSSYPLWYSPSKDGYICWKRLDPVMSSEVALDLLNNQPIQQSDDIITFGPYQRRP